MQKSKCYKCNLNRSTQISQFLPNNFVLTWGSPALSIKEQRWQPWYLIGSGLDILGPCFRNLEKQNTTWDVYLYDVNNGILTTNVTKVLHLREWQDRRWPRTSRWYSSPVKPQKIETSATPKLGKTSNLCQKTIFYEILGGPYNWRRTRNSIRILVIRTCWEEKMSITQTSVPNETHSFLSKVGVPTMFDGFRWCSRDESGLDGSSALTWGFDHFALGHRQAAIVGTICRAKTATWCPKKRIKMKNTFWKSGSCWPKFCQQRSWSTHTWNGDDILWFIWSEINFCILLSSISLTICIMTVIHFLQRSISSLFSPRPFGCPFGFRGNPINSSVEPTTHLWRTYPKWSTVCNGNHVRKTSPPLKFPPDPHGWYPVIQKSWFFKRASRTAEFLSTSHGTTCQVKGSGPFLCLYVTYYKLVIPLTYHLFMMYSQ